MSPHIDHIIVEVHCDAPDDMFGAWEEVSEETRDLLDEQGPTRCDGGGYVGFWCENCPYCGLFERDDDAEIW